MTPRRAAVVASAAALLLAGVAPAHAAHSRTRLSVTVDRDRISTRLGHKFAFRSTITNRGSSAVSGLIAHLNVLSFDPAVYVDPEDWSSHRTRYLVRIPAGGSKTISWRMQAVNDGSFAVYVAVLRRVGPARPPTTGAAMRVSVAKRTTLNSQGIIPLALGIPGILGLLSVGVRLSRKRR